MLFPTTIANLEATTVRPPLVSIEAVGEGNVGPVGSGPGASAERCVFRATSPCGLPTYHDEGKRRVPDWTGPG